MIIYCKAYVCQRLTLHINKISTLQHTVSSLAICGYCNLCGNNKFLADRINQTVLYQAYCLFSTCLYGNTPKNNRITKKLLDLEDRPRRNNLCFDGVTEDPNETSDDCEQKVQDIVLNSLNVEGNIKIDQCHRFGNRRRSGPRIC